MKERYDLIILGSGSTAFAAAVRAAGYGARVLMVEKSVMGGTCINWGCVPSKTLIHASLFAHEARLAERCGLHFTPGGVDFDRLAERKMAAVRHLRRTKYLEVLEEVPGLSLVKGSAVLLSPDTVQVGGDLYSGERILVATGGNPRVPEFPGLQETDWMTSREALLLKRFPRSLLVIGGGVISLELGQMFRRIGCEVTVLERGETILPMVEREPAEALRGALEEEGISLLREVRVSRFFRDGHLSAVEAEVRGERRVFSAEKVLLALGTVPATAGIGLEKAGVETDRRGFIVTDARMRTSTPGVWAAGDVTGGMMIATVGAREGVVAVEDMFNPGCGCAIDHTSMPMAIFTDPEVATVGYSEEGARQAGYSVVCNTLPVAAAAKAHITGHTRGAVKMVAEEGTGRLLGVHLCCHRGAELINEAALAVRFRLSVDDLASTSHVYPSIGEILRLCAQGFRKDVKRLSCCAE